jgi:BirA family biotin operon repressor/biotin-[acetyl-CoA-carboxylase] ligase
MTSPRLPPGYRLHRFETIGSTIDEARRLAQRGEAEGAVVWALEQTGGRGRRGRAWQSPPGNLYLGLLRRPDCAPAAAHQLGFVTALAVADACAVLAPAVERRCKWPNDVLLGGRKVSGILLESESGSPARLDYLVVGVGVNVASHPEGTEYPATSLVEAGAAASVESTLELLLAGFERWERRWRQGGFPAIRGEWLSRAIGLGEEIRVRLDRETFTGRFLDLDADGALLIDTDEGRRRVGAGDVFPAT